MPAANEGAWTPGPLVARIRNRANGAPMPIERLLDEAGDTIADLVEALEGLLGGKCPECKGWGEVAYFGETVPCRCGAKYCHTPSDDQIAKARAALAKARGEVK